VTHIQVLVSPHISGMTAARQFNFLCISMAGGHNQNYAKVGHRGSGSRDLRLISCTP